MDIWFIVMELVMLLGGAFLLGTLAQRLGQSPILGYLLAGTVVGPLLQNTAAVNQASELGVALLLFAIGLEFNLKQLLKMGKMAFGGGTLQVLFTMVVVTWITAFMVELPRAITLGAIAALSSTTIVLRILVDRVEMDSIKGRTCLAILLLQDMAIVPLVLMVGFFTPASEINIGLHMAKVILSAVGLTAVFYLFLYHIAPKLLSETTLFANRELTVLLSVAVGFGAAWAAHRLHISPALGAFVAGMLLGESPFATQIRADIGSMRIIMVTLFFASVGMQAKPLWFANHLHWIVLISALTLILKTIIIFTITRFLGLNTHQALSTGITLGQVGEFSFVLAETARKGGVLTDNIVDLIVSTIIVLMLITPYLITHADTMAERVASLLYFRRRRSRKALSPPEDNDVRNRVLVIGLGPVGQQVSELLVAHGLEPVVIDANPKSREYADRHSLHLQLGDAGNEEILMHAGLGHLCMAVITIPDPRTAIRITGMIRRLRPLMPIAVRCRYNRYVSDLKELGADIVVDEEMTMGDRLSQKIIDYLKDDTNTLVACRISGRMLESITS